MPETKIYGVQIKEQTVSTEVFMPNTINGNVIENTSITPEKLVEKYSLYGHTHYKSEVVDFAHTHPGNEITSTVANADTVDGKHASDLAPIVHTHVGTDIVTKVANAINAEFVDWTGVLNKPNFADPSWKGVKANRSALTLTGNSIGDTVVVIDDGDGKGALYVCKATSGTVDQQWGKEGDVDFAIPDWANILNKPTTIAGYGLTDAANKIHTHSGSDITSKVASASTADSATNAGNADTVDGLHASAFATASHTHSGSEITSVVANATNAVTAASCTGNAATATVAAKANSIPTSDVGGNIWIS